MAAARRRLVGPSHRWHATLITGLGLGVFALIAASGRSAQADFLTDCADDVVTQTFTDDDMPTSLDLTSADIVLFASGTFTGSVNSNGGTICVDDPAAFNPSTMNGASRMFVRGSALMPPLAADSGASLDNEGTVIFLPQVNVNGVASVVNRAGATIVVQGAGLSLGAGVTVTNAGSIEVQGGVNLDGATVTNESLLVIGGPLNLSGTLTNTAQLDVTGLLTINGGGQLTNACSLTAGGMINNAAFTSSGVTDLGGADLVNNGSAVFRQTAGAITVGNDFTNNGTVNGTGEYLFSGVTLTQGNVTGDSPAAPIVFYDTTPTGAQIFDQQLGTVSNTVREVVAPPPPDVCTTTPPTTTTSTSTSSTTSTTSTAPTTTTSTTTSTTTTAPSTTTSTTTTAPTTTAPSTTTSTTTTAPTTTAPSTTTSTTTTAPTTTAPTTTTTAPSTTTTAPTTTAPTTTTTAPTTTTSTTTTTAPTTTTSTTTTTPPTTTVPPTSGPTTSAVASVTTASPPSASSIDPPGDPDDGRLPFTGATPTASALVGAALCLLAGAGLLAAGRLRHR